jgi:hypothetical protein
LNDHAGAQGKLKLVAAIPRRIELLTSRGGDSDVVHNNRATGYCFGTVTNDDVFDDEFGRRTAEMGFNDWF